MKTIVVMNAVELSEYALEKKFDGKSAFERSLEWAKKNPNWEKTLIITDPSTQSKITEYSTDKAEIVSAEKWELPSFFSELKNRTKDFETVVYGFCDCPFYDEKLTSELYELFSQNAAEYCFADGYPLGLVPEVMHTDLISILAALCTEEKFKNTKLTRDSIFTVIKTDINSFDIETLIADHDYRYLRYNFSCNTKRNALLCQNLFEFSKKNPDIDISSLAEQNIECIQTLPAYYSIQITTSASKTCTYLPYNKVSEDKPDSFMSINDFSNLIEKIYNYSNDAVINLSLWGEPTRHPELLAFIKKVLEYPTLSVLIESTGEGITEDLAKEVFETIQKSNNCKNDQGPINWIITLDSNDEQMYANIHGNPTDADGNPMTFARAIKAIDILKKYFPKNVYPQFTRTLDNETQLEAFYRFWKAADENNSGNLIIQKYDTYCGVLPERKPADLRPVLRAPCWQLRRDMYILFDGSVPLCRESLISNIVGNAFAESLEEITSKRQPCLKSQIKKEYAEICRNCDEYYTYNF